MKKFLLFILIFIAGNLFAQNTSQAPVQNISTDNNVVYRLFSTRNMYTFIKLDTRNGQMWQVQWDTKSNQFETPLSLVYLVSEEDEKMEDFSFIQQLTSIILF